MAGRYLISGVQLGMIRGLMRTPLKTLEEKEIINVINEVTEHQFIGDSSLSVKEAAKVIVKLDWEE